MTRAQCKGVRASRIEPERLLREQLPPWLST
jgi:hypothetical protein